jgi:hypothetical protein
LAKFRHKILNMRKFFGRYCTITTIFLDLHKKISVMLQLQSFAKRTRGVMCHYDNRPVPVLEELCMEFGTQTGSFLWLRQRINVQCWISKSIISLKEISTYVHMFRHFCVGGVLQLQSFVKRARGVMYHYDNRPVPVLEELCTVMYHYRKRSVPLPEQSFAAITRLLYLR